MFGDKTIFESEEQFMKHAFPIDETLDGIIISPNLVQYAKQKSESDCRFVERSIFVSDEQ